MTLTEGPLDPEDEMTPVSESDLEREIENDNWVRFYHNRDWNWYNLGYLSL